MRLIKIYLFFFLLIFLSGCGEQHTQENKNSQTYVSDIDLREDLDVLTSKMTEKDTIKVMANLTMEYWVRMDRLVITKSKDSIILQATIEEDTTFERKFEMLVRELPPVGIKTKDRHFENYFFSKLERTDSLKEKYNNWFYKIINQTDTLTFYTYGLGDRGGLVGEHFHFMQEYYPDKEEYKPIEVIEESEINENPG
jgi:hypothetical protein